MWVAGIDEAGRGPCIGPLVVAIVAIPQSDIPLLEEQGIDDSKKLSPKRRLECHDWLYEQSQHRGWRIEVLNAMPYHIDNWMESKSLNDLEVEMFAYVANKILPPKNQDEGILHLDACDVNEQRFGDNIGARLNDWPWGNWEITSEHGADAKHLVVGAASIIAKQVRDTLIEKLKQEEGIPFGSGYPSDPNTRKVLPELVKGATPHRMLRWKWKTTENAWKDSHDSPIPTRSRESSLFKERNLLDY
jgi:ribonuclease HII